MMAASLKLLKSDELLFKSLLVELTEGGDVERFRVFIREVRTEASRLPWYTVTVNGANFGKPEEIAVLEVDVDGDFHPCGWFGQQLEANYGSGLEPAALTAVKKWLEKEGAAA